MTTITYFKAVILGLVQGLSEFLPISSSGHLALLQYFFGVEGDSVLIFTVLLHLGTLVAVFVVYWNDIWELLKELFALIKEVCTGKGFHINVNETRRLGAMIIVASIPTAIIGLAFNDLFESFYSNIVAIGTGLLITGTLLWIAQRMGTGKKTASTMNYRNAIFVGIMQGIAITPGISRSGSTLFGGLITQLERGFAVKFAFLISIPSILGSFLLELPDAISLGRGAQPMGPIFVGMAVAALSGFFAIKLMIKLVTDQKLTAFSFYTWIVGAFVIAYSLFVA